jgi:hypothetical protein
MLGLEWTLGIFFALITGSYGFTMVVGKWLAGKIDRLENNHMKHFTDDLFEIQEKLRKLEGKDDE